jgi:hypothetical protein
MKRIAVTDNFFLDELIDPVTYSARGARSIELIDMRIVLALQHLREVSGRAITVNNWHKGGSLRLRGYRPEGTRTGAKWSQHKYGRAIDFHIEGLSVTQAQLLVLQHEQFFIERQWITVMEDARDTPGWTHIDCRYTGQDKIRIVRA